MSKTMENKDIALKEQRMIKLLYHLSQCTTNNSQTPKRSNRRKEKPNDNKQTF